MKRETMEVIVCNCKENEDGDEGILTAPFDSFLLTIFSFKTSFNSLRDRNNALTFSAFFILTGNNFNFFLRT